MSTTMTNPAQHQARQHLFDRLALSAAAAAVFAAALFVGAGRTDSGPAGAAGTKDEAGLTSEQIVIRGEVADRYAYAALSPEQIVIRGEVADRYAPAGLSAEQVVIRGEVADRYGDQ
jgi:hypothetical protein